MTTSRAGQPHEQSPPDIEQQFRRRLRRTALSPSIALVGVVAVLLVLVVNLQRKNASVDHTDVVLVRAHFVERLVMDREAQLHGYLMSGERGFLEAYEESLTAACRSPSMVSGSL